MVEGTTDVSDRVAELRPRLSDVEDGSLSFVLEDESVESGNRTVVGGKEEEEEKYGREGDLLVEEGILSGVKPKLGNVFVIAEESPSFLLLLGTTAWDSVSCFCPYGPCNWLIRDNPEPWSFKESLDELESEAKDLGGTKRTFLIQGNDPTFISRALIKIHNIFDSGSDTLLVVSSQRLRRQPAWSNWKIHWSNLRHCDVGGVSNKLFSVGLHSPTSSTEGKPAGNGQVDKAASSVQRFVKGIQKVDIGGKECSPPTDLSSGSGELFLDPSSHVKPSELLETFRLKSVFSKTSWVARKLSNKEIGAAWDLPPDRIRKMETELLLGRLTTSKFVQSPPLKILQEAMSLLYPSILMLDGASEKVDITSSENAFKLSTFIPETIIQEVKAAHTKAVKNDDAATETEMWDQACVAGFDSKVHGPLFEFLRSCSVTRFVRNATKSFNLYLLKAHDFVWTKESEAEVDTFSELGKDLAAGKDALERAEGSSFWSWDSGSSPFFWRWQPEVQKDMRDGSKLFVIKSKLPKYHRKQELPKDETIFGRIREKIQKVRLRGYIAVGLVLSLTSFFHVPKGEDDIRMVYDATACGLNDALWAPGFWMPTIMNVLDCATADSWFGDVDAAEMFLNYLLDVDVRPYAGIDVSWLQEDGSTSRRWERWTRMAMGMSPSPFVTIRLFAWAMEIILGDHTDPNNPFYWSEIRINCPGSPDYDPSLPRCYKWNDVKKCIAADCVTFVDDLRTIGACFALVQAATHRVETMMGYLGLQDATRKRRPNSQTPGEWTGSKSVAIPNVGLFVTVSQKKWDKAKGIITSLFDEFESETARPEFNLKDMEQKVGFLVHLAMAYPLMLPFLRGLYLTMNSWRTGRDANGWKLSGRAYASMMSEMRGSGTWTGPVHSSNKRGPEKVRAVPLLFDHLNALRKLFENVEPTLRLIRGASICEAAYVFGDASGEGFGSSWVNKEGAIGFRFGVWGREGEGSSSNYRELRNLVETLERLGELGELVGREVFLFTDNSVSESIAAKGSSSSPKLYELVVRIFRLEMKYLCKLEIVHVAGTRMIEQGTDGLSRGDMYEGVMAGRSMLSFVPLHKSAGERSPEIIPWVQSWASGCRGEVAELLTPSGWYTRGHDHKGCRRNIDGYWMPGYQAGTFIWDPAPGIARFAIEQLRQARMKRQASMHVFIVPRLMNQEWRRNVLKAADLKFEVPVGHPCWSVNMHEPLTIAVVFPYLSRQPWELRKTGLMVEMGGKVQRVLKENPALGFDLLSKLCILTGKMESMSVLRLCRVLRGSRETEVPS